MKLKYERYKDKIDKKIKEVMEQEKNDYYVYEFLRDDTLQELERYDKKTIPWRQKSRNLIDKLNKMRIENSESALVVPLDDVSKTIEACDEYYNRLEGDNELVRVYWKEFDASKSKNLLEYDDFLTGFGLEQKRNDRLGVYYYEAENVSSNTTHLLLQNVKELDFPLTVKSCKMRWARGNQYKKRYDDWFNTNETRKCIYCGGTDNNEIDHIFPVSKLTTDESVRKMAQKYGITRADSPKNLAPICHFCNQAKGNTVTDQWILPAMEWKEKQIQELVDKLHNDMAVTMYVDEKKAKDPDFVYVDKEELKKQEEEERRKEKELEELAKQEDREYRKEHPIKWFFEELYYIFLFIKKYLPWAIFIIFGSIIIFLNIADGLLANFIK